MYQEYRASASNKIALFWKLRRSKNTWIEKYKLLKKYEKA
jgi:hypothetical protein